MSSFFNTEFNDMRKKFFLSKSETSFERNSVCNIIEDFGGAWDTLCHALILMTS